MNDKQEHIAKRAEVFKALGHPTRLLFVMALAEGERCVCELQKLVDIDPSTVSRHLGALKHAGVVRDDKRGQQVFYSLRLPCVAGFVGCIDRALEER
ncbi:MAG: metalloregulator ArsR/SmtB family transcription factor [Candidatus Cloacimonetes bacterium]|nr:metalloregulator ArsR/SmtB family transcription factor [Candidatus Cloacimonadota bacterium]